MIISVYNPSTFILILATNLPFPAQEWFGFRSGGDLPPNLAKTIIPGQKPSLPPQIPSSLKQIHHQALERRSKRTLCMHTPFKDGPSGMQLRNVNSLSAKQRSVWAYSRQPGADSIPCGLLTLLLYKLQRPLSLSYSYYSLWKPPPIYFQWTIQV